MSRVVVAGHICMDLIPTLSQVPSLVPGELVEVGPITIRPGGSVFNTGGALAALGVEIYAAGSIGDDPLGAMLRNALAIPNVDGAGIDAVPGANTSYSIVVEAAGRSRTLWHHVGAAEAFTGSAVDASTADLVHLGYPPALPGMIANGGVNLLRFLARVRSDGATSSVDMSVVDPASRAATVDWSVLIDKMLSHVDVFTPSVDDLTSSGYITAGHSREQILEAADRMISRGAAVVLLSDGDRGALLRTAGGARLAEGGRLLRALGSEWECVERWIVPEPIDEIVTTNGAGDVFTAGLIFALLNGYSPEEAGRFAASLAATKIRGQELGTARTLHAQTRKPLSGAD